MFTPNSSIGKVELMMDLISQRQVALGSNLANIHTPGYVRRDIDFQEYLGSMDSPLETKLSQRLGPSAIIETKSGEEIRPDKELLEIQNTLSDLNVVSIYGITSQQLDITTYALYVLMELAVSDWEKEHEGEKLSDAEWVDLIFRGISDLDSNSLNYIKNCKKLSLSSNFITKIPDMHFDNLEILSLGRNKIR